MAAKAHQSKLSIHAGGENAISRPFIGFDTHQDLSIALPGQSDQITQIVIWPKSDGFGEA